MLELREFFIEGKDRTNSHALLHITEPSTPEEKAKGYFFALTEINHGNKEQIEHLQKMIDDLESGYYETDDTKNKSGFEATLEYINKRGHHILQNKKASINIIVGVINNNDLSFAYHGSPIVQLAYERNNKIKIIDVIGESEPESDQLFSAVMEGNLGSKDYFYVATPSVAKHIGTEKIRTILESRPPSQAVGYIQNSLNGVRDEMSYGGIICHNNKNQDKLSKETYKTPAAESEKSTPHSNNKIIDNPAPDTTKKTSIESNYRPRTKEREEALGGTILFNLGRALVSGVVGLFKIIKSLIKFLGKFLIAIFLLITNKGGNRATVIQSFHDWVTKRKTYIADLPLISKILFVLTIGFALIFIGSIGFLRAKESREIARQNIKNEIQAIVDKKNAAEASLIYGDDNKAFSLLQEAKDLILPLSDKVKEENDLNKIIDEIDNSFKTLRKVYTVNAELVTDLALTNEKVSVTRLAKLADKIYAFGPDDTILYQIDPVTNKLITIDHENINGIITATTPKEDDKIVFLTKNSELASYDTNSGRLVSKQIAVSEGSVLSTISIYNQSLYSIDNKKNQIIKHSQTQTGYDRGTNWLKNTETDLSNATSLAIDGDLFVLTKNDLYKFSSGNKTDFSISNLDPALENPTELWTYNDVKKLYIIEPTHKRLLVIDKDGKLEKQYTSEGWQAPTSMLVFESEGFAFILDNNKIYKIQI